MKVNPEKINVIHILLIFFNDFEILSIMLYYFEINKLVQSIHSIDHNHCPICESELNYDNQNDSIYISCSKKLKHFEVAGFKDKSSGELALLYTNNLEGIVNKTVLKEFQNVIYRKGYSSFKK